MQWWRSVRYGLAMEKRGREAFIVATPGMHSQVRVLAEAEKPKNEKTIRNG